MGEYCQWIVMRGNPRATAILAATDIVRAIVRRVPALRSQLIRLRQAIGSRAGPQPDPELPLGLQAAIRQLGGPVRVNRRGRDLRIVHCIGSLQPGGAERQFCNFVVGAKCKGWDIEALTLLDLEGEHAHYLDLLERADLHARVAGKRFDPSFGRMVRTLPGGVEMLARLPGFFLPWTVDILGELLADAPDVFHCWLDHTNIWGGIAAVLAGVPIIVLSTRNVNPSHFSYIANPYLRLAYKLLALSPRVHFINNSHAGAQDYADWLDIPPERFRVIHNGVDFGTVHRASTEQVAAFREEIAIPPKARLVIGIFRLSEEKQPRVFVEVLSRAMAERKDLYAVMIGIGRMESDVRAAIYSSGLSDRFRLLGRRKDIPVALTAADLFLLTSRHEGTPNVLLEAQWLGCPVVSTRAGGAGDAISHGRTGFVTDVGEVSGLVQSVVRLLDDEDMRRRFGAAGPDFIRSQFGLDQMVESTLDVYTEAQDSCLPFRGALAS